MTENLHFILSLGILFSAILGMIRFRVIDKSYYPFIYYTWLVVGVEVLVFFFNKMPQLASLVVNLFSFAEFYLFARLFHNWGLFNRKSKVFYSIIAIYFALWLVTTLLVSGFTNPNWHYLVVHSFTLIFFSVTTFNKIIVHERRNILTNARFWICMGVIIFFTFFLIFSTSQISLFRQNISKAFINSFFTINVYSNLFVNLLYAVAVLWIPRKQNFTNPF